MWIEIWFVAVGAKKETIAEQLKANLIIAEFAALVL